jgi:hypothetical protein
MPAGDTAIDILSQRYVGTISQPTLPMPSRSPTMFPTPPSSQSPQAHPETATSDTGRLLESLTAELIIALFNTDHSDPDCALFLSTYISPHYEARYGGTQLLSTSREQLLQNVRQAKNALPDGKVEILSMCSAVDEKRGKADVWILQKGLGYPFDGLGREGVRVVRWRRQKAPWLDNNREKRWVCVGHDSLNGGAFAGCVGGLMNYSMGLSTYGTTGW